MMIDIIIQCCSKRCQKKKSFQKERCDVRVVPGTRVVRVACVRDSVMCDDVHNNHNVTFVRTTRTLVHT